MQRKEFFVENEMHAHNIIPSILNTKLEIFKFMKLQLHLTVFI